MRCWEGEHVGDWLPDDPKWKTWLEGGGVTQPYVWVQRCWADGGSQVFGEDVSFMLCDMTLSQGTFVGFDA